MTSIVDRRLSVAPMMDWTDRHDRYLLRLISRRTLLYTEMVPAVAIWYGKSDHLLRYNPEEHPVAVQFGGSEPAQLAFCASEAERFGYDEVNLNVGCPSDRVQAGRFGACLMAEPDTVADCVAAMSEATSLPVTVKTRIGIDDMDEYADLQRFVERVAAAGCRTFIVHARKAWLQGLSPKENREKPPLNHERVYRLKAEVPELEIIINGGVAGLDEAEGHLQRVDGVMIGRDAYQNPYSLAAADARIFGEPGEPLSRHEVVRRYAAYVRGQLAQGVRLSRMSRHLVGLFHGVPGGKRWRRHLSEAGNRPEAGVEVLEQAAAMVDNSSVTALAG
ncbi:tRNA dihydrouridine(20/20a) synthase DusA [Ectothiorhodospiraceae bacterium WFHF3C12]|nr:tRNA dihydrouridine(20/20a) synthase DusA [Ectothiorhodospiraceae bacterium WFHF3C12]